MSTPLLPGIERTQIRRRPDRALYDREEVVAILDEGFVCHVGFVADGYPQVLPTAYGRMGDEVYIHGSAMSHMLRSLSEGIDVCVTVTLVDGLVLARSARRHSLNYRSVVLYGKARLVTDPTEKMCAMESFVNHVIPGRWDEVRAPDEKEMAQTSVLALPIHEASAKQRKGPPLDAPQDLSPDVWAGVIPVRTVMAEPLPDEHTRETLRFDLKRFDRR